jgi:hypothetical protein
VQVFRYQDEDLEGLCIKGGMVVRLLHSEKGGFLHSDDKDFTDDGLAEVYLWNFKGKSTNIEALSSSSLFEIEVANPIRSEKNQTSNDMGEDQEVKRQDPENRFGKVFDFSPMEPVSYEEKFE